MYSFEDVINPICWCGTDVEFVAHFFLHFSSNFLIKKAAIAGVQLKKGVLAKFTENAFARVSFFNKFAG